MVWNYSKFLYYSEYHYFKYEKNDIDLKYTNIEKTENLYYYIELLDIIEPKKKIIYNTFESIYEFYNEKKTEGNEFFAKGDYLTAYKRYERPINAYHCVFFLKLVS
jgi:GMP synthase PP-ATPase subunit